MSFRNKAILAVALAALVTLLASWLTSGQFDPVAGKPLMVGALIVLPLVVAAKNDVTGMAATALAFTTYLALAVLVVWLATRRKRVKSGFPPSRQ
jgi:hypothetical protein